MSAPMLMDGTQVQSLMSRSAESSEDQYIYYPVMGVVLNVYYVDEPTKNSSTFAAPSGAMASGNPLQVGSRVECDVLVLRDRRPTNYTLRNVVILQNKTGVDDYSEEYPTPASPGMLTKLQRREIDPSQIDGDWVVVQFIGGRINMPYVVKWFPHPGNKFDNAQKADKQRVRRRRRGTKTAIDNEGNIEVDTTEANGLLDTKTGKRSRNDKGGSVTLKIKDNQQVKLDWGDGNFVSIKKQNGVFTVSVKDESGQHAVLGENLLDHLNQMKTDFTNFYTGEYLAHQHIGNLGAPTPLIPTVNQGLFPQATSALLSANLLLKEENP